MEPGPHHPLRLPRLSHDPTGPDVGQKAANLMTTHQNRPAVPRRRRLIAVAGAATLTAATLLVGAPSASAASQTITGATFEWSLNDYIQYTGTGAPGSCHYLAAGSLDGTSAALTQSSYKAVDGNVSIMLGAAAPTFATKCSGMGSITGGNTATGSPGNQRAIFSNGTGIRDTTTGAVTITFPGTLSVKFSGAPFRMVDPVLSVDGSGVGTLKATITAGANPAATVDTANVTVAELTGVPVSGPSGFISTPTFFGRMITVGTTSTPTQANKDLYDAIGANLWGAWPESFVNAANTGSVNAGGRFHSSAPTTSGDGFKEPNPITVSFGALGPVTNNQNLNLIVPTIACTGEVSMTIADDGAVAMGTAAFVTDRLRATGAIDPITINDTRVGSGACRPAFAVSGSVSEFTATGVPALSASYLGWAPNVTSGSGLVVGPTVAPGYLPAGDGLSQPTQLVSTAADTTGTGTAGAALTLELPPTTQPGDYQGTLTLTGLT